LQFSISHEAKIAKNIAPENQGIKVDESINNNNDLVFWCNTICAKSTIHLKYTHGSIGTLWGKNDK
jgi:hypothetical protein